MKNVSFGHGFGGNDLVYGNENPDTFLAGAEDSDVVHGNTGNDVIRADFADSPAGTSDQSYGEAGNDQIFAQDGNFVFINCGSGTSDAAFKDPGDTATNCESVSNSSTAAAAAAKVLPQGIEPR